MIKNPLWGNKDNHEGIYVPFKLDIHKSKLDVADLI
jgi:hypothetical protein